MDIEKIRHRAADVLVHCHVRQFPLDCFRLLNSYGYKVYTYSQLKAVNSELYQMCIDFSEDAFRHGSARLIAYNENMPAARIRFSLMHELGHHVLGHRFQSPENEQEANYFSSSLLAPRLAMYYAKSFTASDTAKIFQISLPAARCALQDFNEWAQHISRDGMSLSDRLLYQQFYNESYGGFVYHTDRCAFCGAVIYNTYEKCCPDGCSVPEEMPYFTSCSAPYEDRQVLNRLEHQWLYDI